MKKSILLFTVALGMLTACDPIKEEGEMSIDKFSASTLLDGATFSQYADADCTTPQADGNFIKYDIPKASSVYIYYLKADGSEFKLASGSAGGVFNFVPSRGSDPNQTVYFKYINANKEETVASKEFTVAVAAELNPEIRLLASNDYGKKTWKWDPSVTGAVWGNMGYQPGDGASVGTTGNGQWWGVTSTEEFNGQLNHTEDGTNHGDGDLNAYMVFSEDGIATVYDASGSAIRTDAYSVTDYTGSYDASNWKLGNLNTKAILWPYEINSNGNIPGTYEIVYLTPDKLTLVYPDGGNQGAWGEASFWHFTSSSDVLGMAYGYDNGKDWTWDYDGTNTVWGNMGYCGGAGADVGIAHNGQWWGVTNEEEFMGQLGHTPDNAAHGDESMDAYFTLTPDGVITRHAGDGSVINSGTFSIDESVASDWKVANLNTTAGTILFPYEINSNGRMPETFEMVYLTGSKMCLVYPDNGDFAGNGGWGEATYWHFKAK